jgi:hypothetical protein
VTNAELIGIVECPFPQQEWDVVPVEPPETSEDESSVGKPGAASST